MIFRFEAELGQESDSSTQVRERCWLLGQMHQLSTWQFACFSSLGALNGSRSSKPRSVPELHEFSEGRIRLFIAWAWITV